MQIKKYAAIDIGSNGVRLLITNIILKKNAPATFKKNNMIRVPIRLGLDVFQCGKISEENINLLVDTLKAFGLLMKIYEVEKYIVCATSALRCAENKMPILKTIQKQTSMEIQLIDGKKEAEIIASMDISKNIEGHKNYLYVDVGGGSTEYSIFKKNEKIASESFKIGTVRLLKNKIDKNIWEQMKLWIKKYTKNTKNIILVGSGGNINKIFKISGRQTGKPLSFEYMNTQYKNLKNMNYQQRICELGLNEDRADVIIPAMKIYVSSMKWSHAQKIYVPKIGLADGMIKFLLKQNFTPQ